MATNHQFEQRLEKHMEELARLHNEALRAADLVKDGADRTEKAIEKIEAWTLAIQKRVENLEHFKTGALAGGVVVGFLLKEKVMAILGLKVSE
jgi:hypothetical protein